MLVCRSVVLPIDNPFILHLLPKNDGKNVRVARIEMIGDQKQQPINWIEMLQKWLVRNARINSF